jgi:cytochrome c2
LSLASFHTPAAAVSLLASAIFAVTLVAQAPPVPPSAPGGPPPPHSRPAPTNLRVLPKTTTGDQIHDIMEKWAGSLGVHCDTCHTEDPKKIGPNGRPQLIFADDSKKEKDKARLMYKMTEDMNKNYLSMIEHEDDKPGKTVTCGTCHRGHKEPEEFVIPHPQGPPPPQGQPPVKDEHEHKD